MPTKTSVQNNFTKGLLTEFSGLNFPENACTATSNCTFHRIGNVTRRNGFDYEINFVLTKVDRTQRAISTFRWLDAGGDGETQLLVVQVGSTLYFFESSNAITSSPLSAQRLASTVDLTNFSSSTTSPSVSECQYSYGNGYLFVYNPNTNPFYCTFANGVIAANVINIKIRDFVGNVELTIPDTLRPNTLGIAHQYNLQNQGWISQVAWTTHSSSTVLLLAPDFTGTYSFTVDAGLPVVSGTRVSIFTRGQVVQNPGGTNPAGGTLGGVVTNYAGTTMTVNITNVVTVIPPNQNIVEYGSNDWTFSPGEGGGQISTWFSEVGNYPSNADVWWHFKDTSQVFNPGLTIGNVTLNSGPAPKGFYILDAFNQDRSLASTVLGINPVSTTSRPKTGCWFQGRVWYTGVDASVFQNDLVTNGSPLSYSWAENIYFSQIITNTSQFGKCHQTNDPTSEDLFDLLPTDGGVIQIQGAGSIFKLFPIQNGLLVFAANGIWFITGSSGVGFSANDYTITKISGIESLSSTSFVDVQGLPMFWNEEDIYYVTPSQQDKRNNEQLGLSVSPITLTTIKKFYSQIPVSSKKFARGAYNPITNIVQWVYRSTNEFDVTSRYEFDTALNFNTLTQAFYPWTISGSSATPHVHGINYIIGPGGSQSPDPTFKYVTTAFVG